MGMLIVYTNEQGRKISQTIIEDEIDYSLISLNELTQANFNRYDKIVFIGALGICVRKILPFIKSKHSDPAVVCIDSTGKFVISVLSGHIGGANELCKSLAFKLGAQPVITTQSDNMNLWSLDLIGKKYNWAQEIAGGNLNEAVSRFVNKEKTALCIEVYDKNAEELILTVPSFVDVYNNFSDIDQSKYKLIITISPKVYTVEDNSLIIWFRPKVLSLGLGCKKNINPSGIPEFINKDIIANGFSPLSIYNISTIELKKDELLISSIINFFPDTELNIYDVKELEGIDVANPSERVKEITGIWGVAESCAIKSACYGPLVIEKQKKYLTKGADFTYAVAINSSAICHGHVEIVGAGPGDPELISLKGKKYLENADLILYAGSLVPIELTYYAKEGCLIKSSANMALEEQLNLMKKYYDMGKQIVRLHTGDPCIYGAIQEQMAFFDKHDMSYHITPGISSFQAAAAELKSQFTIPEKVQTIILTRGEGKTPMPEKERLRNLAQSQSTMCIFLSAVIVEKVQAELLESYPPDTPVAACYKLTWKDQKIYRGELKDLANIVKNNGLSLTTLLVVGEAIDNRSGFSKLYDKSFSHLFRK